MNQTKSFLLHFFSKLGIEHGEGGLLVFYDKLLKPFCFNILYVAIDSRSMVFKTTMVNTKTPILRGTLLIHTPKINITSNTTKKGIET
jgi:hypothetical protein